MARHDRCENGEGEACDRLAEGNELVKKLQAQSKANKEKNARELMDKTYMQLGYSDFFDAYDKNLVKLANGSYVALDMETYSQLRKEGRIKPGMIDELKETEKIPAVPAGPSDVSQSAWGGDGPLSYAQFKAALAAKKVEGVVFQPPLGLTAFAIVDDNARRVDFGAAWKREEAASLLARQSLPNNLNEVLAAR